MTEKQLRRDARRMFDAALRAADPEEAVLRFAGLDGDRLRISSRRRYRLSAFDNIYVLGAGKASAAMARAV